MLIWASPIPASAEIGSARVHGPESGVPLVEIVESAEDQRITPELIAAVKNGADEFRKANFGAAVDWYELAARLAPEGTELKAQLGAMARIAGEKRFLQAETQKLLTGSEDEISERYKATYAQARRYYRDADYENSYKMFHDLWLVAGDYKGTLSYLAKSRERGGLETASLLAAPSAAATASAPKPETPTETLAAAPSEGFQALQINAPELVEISEAAEANQVDELILQAQVEAQAGRVAESRALYGEALALDPENSIVKRGIEGLDRVEKEQAAQEQVRQEKAREEAARQEAALEEQAQQEAARQEAALQEQAQREQAQREQAELERQGNVKRLVAQGGELEARQEWAGAEAAYREAMEYAPGSPEIESALERVQASAKAAEEAARPTQALDRARQALKTGSYDAAEAAYREALEIEPKNEEALAGLTNVETARAEAAKNDLEKTLELALRQGESFLSKGKHEQARSAFQTALTLDPGNVRAEAGLGRIASAESGVKPEAYGNAATASPEAPRREYQVAQADEATAGQGVPAETPAGGAVDAPSAENPDDILHTVVDPTPPPAPEPAAAAPAEVQEPAAPTAEPAPAPAPQKKGWFRGLFSGDSAAERGTTAMAAAPAAPAPAAAPSAPAGNPQVSQLLDDARYQYEVERNLESARQKWQWVLEIDPGNKVASTYLAETAGEYEKYKATKVNQEQAAEKKKAQETLLQSPLTIQTDRPTALSEFMRLISFSTAEEIEYYIADGADTPVFVNFVDRPLSEVLDSVLLPVGLTWSINENNLITIETDLRHNAFRLTEAQVGQIRSLLQSGRLQTAIWGQPEAPSKGIEMTLDERQKVLLVVGSRLHVQKVQDLLSSLDTAERPTLDTVFYKIREQDGPKIKSLINAIVTADQGSPFEMDRRIFVDGDDLIIRDTPDNLTKIEELLLDQNFIQKMRDENLEITNFNLAPKDFETTPRDVIDTFTSRIVITIKTLLYAKTGEEAAAAEGRKLFFDNATYQLTIIDTPSNLARVGNYLNSLPELQRKRQQQVVFLEHAVAESLASDLVSILGLRGALAGVEGGETVVKRLRRGEEFTFKDLRVRVVRIEENDENDRQDDSVEINIITGTNSSNLNLRELDTTFFENYEITAEDIQATGTEDRPGEGVARILFRYVGDEAEREALAEEEVQQTEEVSEEEGISIFPFGPLNALIIRYDNPAILQDVQELIVQLDRPTPQVEVETKFVQVNEQRAREFSADFGLENLVNGQELNADFFNFNAGFARARDEVRNIGDVPLENPWAANLPNGATVLDFVLGTGIPGLSFQLRMLEAEGVLNIVNGPKVTMLDNEQGEFRIERGSPYPGDNGISTFAVNQGTGPGTIFPSTSASGGTQTLPITNEFATATSESLENEGGATLTNRVSAVVLLVTPQVTSEKSIIFEITAEILDLDNFIGSQAFVGADPLTNQTTPFLDQDRNEAIAQQQAILASHEQMLQAMADSGIDFTLEENQDFLESLNTLLSDTLGGLAGVIDSVNPLDSSPTGGASFQDFQRRAAMQNMGLMSQLGLLTPGQMLRTRKLINTRARTSDGGTIVLGGWTGERTIESTSGVPVLRNMPYVGKLFSRNARSSDRTTLLIFLTAHLID